MSARKSARITEEDAEQWAAEVRRLDREGDFEAAHGNEDRLREKVLQAVAHSTMTKVKLQRLAKVALSTDPEGKAKRYCA